MGMPINSYRILRTLADIDRESHTWAAVEDLRRFCLYTFVIHDPEQHADFDKSLAVMFDRLDYVTGNKLLFFALVNPPADWLSHAGDRAYYRRLSSWAAESLADPHGAARSEDSGLAALSLAAALGIPSDTLPCIVVTDDFRRREFLWTRTSAQLIEQQLQTLGYLASRHQHDWESCRDEMRVLHRVAESTAPCVSEGGRTEKLERSLARTLSDILALIMAGAQQPWQSSGPVGQQARDALADLRRKLSQLKGSFPDEGDSELDRLSFAVASAVLHLSGRALAPQQLPIARELLEPDSHTVLRTAYKVFAILDAQRDSMTPTATPSEDDWTPVVVCQAKVFEKEVNLSVIHWLRKELGVSLPAFFNRYQPNLPAPAEYDDTNFNQQGIHGSWRGPTLGRSEMACRKYSACVLPSSWTRSEWNSLLDDWARIREERNRAAHSEVVGRESAERVHRSLSSLAAMRLFNKLNRMKCMYRGSTPVAGLS